MISPAANKILNARRKPAAIGGTLDKSDFTDIYYGMTVIGDIETILRQAAVNFLYVYIDDGFLSKKALAKKILQNQLRTNFVNITEMNPDSQNNIGFGDTGGFNATVLSQFMDQFNSNPDGVMPSVFYTYAYYRIQILNAAFLSLYPPSVNPNPVKTNLFSNMVNRVNAAYPNSIDPASYGFYNSLWQSSTYFNPTVYNATLAYAQNNLGLLDFDTWYNKYSTVAISGIGFTAAQLTAQQNKTMNTIATALEVGAAVIGTAVGFPPLGAIIASALKLADLIYGFAKDFLDNHVNERLAQWSQGITSATAPDLPNDNNPQETNNHDFPLLRYLNMAAAQAGTTASLAVSQSVKNSIAYNSNPDNFKSNTVVVQTSAPVPQNQSQAAAAAPLQSYAQQQAAQTSAPASAAGPAAAPSSFPWLLAAGAVAALLLL
jgi:hypothetical protein